MQTGWQDIGGVRYYLNDSGSLQTGWARIDGAWYYLNGSGTMATGWQEIAGALYYLDPATGHLAVDAVLERDGVPYQADGNGICTPIEPQA